MAEILLEPSSLSKIIPLSFDLNDTNASNAAQLMTKRQFNTADTDAWFQISLEGFVDTAGSFDITLFNLNDKSVFNHTGKPFTTNPFYYKLDSGSDETTNEIRHAGRWIGQIVVTLANGDSATRKFIFDIEGHILDGADVQTILLEDYNALIATINTSKDLLTQYNVDYAALLVDLAAAEAARSNTYNQLVADQQANIDAFDVALDTGIVAANLATKLQTFEATNNSRLLSTEQQLAEADSKIKASTSLQMLQFTAKGKAFDATTEASHCAWPYSKLHYDKDTSQFMFIYMAGQSHGVYQDKIYLRKKPVQGEWGAATLIADETANLQGCTCQAATITSDGRWLAIISKIVTATNEVLGAWLYVSNDKGATWTNSEIRIGGLPVTGRTGDVNALTQLESGRLIAWGWTIYGKSFVIYSDDVGETWAYGQVGQFDNIYDVFEPAFVELSNGTIIAILRDGWTPSDQLGADRPPRISKSFDGGITWSNPVLSTSIKDMNGNNGCFVHHKESKTVEFICCTRKPSADNQASIYQYVCTEEDAENDLFGERYRIGYGPDYLTDAGVQTTADFGYPAVAVSDDGYAMLMYYTGTKSATSFAYMMGSFAKTAYTQPELSTKSGNLIGYKGAGALVSRFVSPQKIPNNADTVLLFDTVAYDTDKIFNLALNPRRLYVPDGVTKVKISGNVQFAANATGGRTLLIRKNSETNFFGRPTVTIPTRTDGTATSVNITTPILQVVAGDWFELFVSQNSGGDLNVNSGYSTWMAMEIVQ